MSIFDNAFENETILVTGGTGSIGSQVVEALLKHAPHAVRIMSRGELAQFEMKRRMRGRRTRFLIGDVRDKDRLFEAMHGCDYVFHCAAMKHVGICEHNVAEAFKTNLHGTENVLAVAKFTPSVRKVLHLSTDKVVTPTSTMALSKLSAERLVTRHYRHEDRPAVVTVRMGNVIDSSGSFTSLVREAVRAGKPYHITDARMRRFFITKKRAADWVVKALIHGDAGEIWVPMMCEYGIVEMGQSIARNEAHALGIDYDPDNYEVVGAKDNENFREALWTDDERKRLRSVAGGFVIAREA